MRMIKYFIHNSSLYRKDDVIETNERCYLYLYIYILHRSLHRSFLSISISSRLFPASSFDVHKYNIENRVLMIG